MTGVGAVFSALSSCSAVFEFLDQIEWWRLRRLRRQW